MSENRDISVGVLAKSNDWFVDRVWLCTGTLSCDSIRVLSCAIVMFGLSTCRRSNPSLLRILINILQIPVKQPVKLNNLENG